MPPRRHPCPPLWLPGVLPFSRPAALAAGVSQSESVPISHFQEIAPMSGRNLFDAVVRKTGEDSHEIGALNGGERKRIRRLESASPPLSAGAGGGDEASSPSGFSRRVAAQLPR